MLKFRGKTAAEVVEYAGGQKPSVYEEHFVFPASGGNFVSTGDMAFASELDGNPIVRTYDNFTVQSGHLVTVSNRCRGLYLNILGDLIVDGILSMTARGAKGTGRYITIDPRSKEIFFSTSAKDVEGLTGCIIIAATGGVNTTAAKVSGHVDGASGINGACASGGSSYLRGGNGTSFSGGAGAGGGASNHSQSGLSTTAGYANATAGGADGGAGGHGAAVSSQGSYGGGGAGNPGGAVSNARAKAGTAGTGGLMIIFVKGNVIVNGSIQSNGSAGGNGHKTSSGNYPGSMGGSGSGGGAIHLFHRGTLTGMNKITATGGAAGTGLYTGGKGGNGTVNIVQL